MMVSVTNTIYMMASLLFVNHIKHTTTTSSHLGRQQHFLKVTPEIADRISRAETIQEVIKILHPSTDINEVLKRLYVRKTINSNGYEADVGRRSKTRRKRSNRPSERFFEVSYSEMEHVEVDIEISRPILPVAVQIRPAKQTDIQDINEEKNKTKCREPTNVIIKSTELLNIANTVGERQGIYIVPGCVKFPRCQNTSGCCPNGSTCTGKIGSQKNMTKKFFIRNDYTNEEYIEERDFEVFHECECKRTDNILSPIPHTGKHNGEKSERNEKVANKKCKMPKVLDPYSQTCRCSQPCPIPFQIHHPSCKCICSKSDQICRKMRRGRLSLGTEACRCVDHGDCNVPVCQKKMRFDTLQCKCKNVNVNVKKPKMDIV